MLAFTEFVLVLLFGAVSMRECCLLSGDFRIDDSRFTSRLLTPSWNADYIYRPVSIFNDIGSLAVSDSSCAVSNSEEWKVSAKFTTFPVLPGLSKTFGRFTSYSRLGSRTLI